MSNIKEILILKNSYFSSNKFADYSFEFLSISNNYSSFGTKIIGFNNPEYKKENVDILRNMKIGDFIKSLKVPPLSDNIYVDLNINDIIKLKNTLIENSRKNHSHVRLALNKADQLLRKSKLNNILDE